MKVLAIESSSRVGSLAALTVEQDNVCLVASAQLPDSVRSAQSLLPSAQQLLKHCHWKTIDLGLLCVASGPGSFTGLRIGVTVAKTLAYATGAKIVEVNTLAAIAAGVAADVTTPRQNLWTVLDAQRGELFVAKFPHDWQADLSDSPSTSIRAAEAWISQLEAGDYVAGPPLSKLSDQLPTEVIPVDQALWLPQAAVVGQLGIATHRAGLLTDPIQLVPKYFRKSAAEEKADRVTSGN